MTETIRVVWRKKSSGWVNFNWDGVIREDSVVHISASEATVAKQNFFGALGAKRVRSSRTVAVKNVRPHGPNAGDDISGGVEFYLDISWGLVPINVATDITVFDPPEDGGIVG